jgi:exodeoxyribonuclease VII small subunit
MTKAPATFKDAYAVLQSHARTLREQDEPDIDDLLRIVQESVTAYAVCRRRIDAVEKALEETLKGAGVDAANESDLGRDDEVDR